MDLPLEAPADLIRPWRTAAIVAAAIALVELLILLSIGGLALARTVAHHVDRSASAHRAHARAPARRPPKHATKIAPARLPRSKTEVLVLNGNGRQGAAAVEATRVRRRGYRVGGVANAARSDYLRSIVMYRPHYAGEGRRLARDLGIGLVTPLDGMRARDLHGAQVVVILGR